MAVGKSTLARKTEPGYGLKAKGETARRREAPGWSGGNEQPVADEPAQNQERRMYYNYMMISAMILLALVMFLIAGGSL